ncbi:MAG: YaiI/YqxD family protein [Anaerolineaceae bacterium]|nr:MAG: YaiI/YqxD family protein [Anaerolineaceae bacterium]
MKILVDADACPVKDIIEEVAKEYNISVYMFVDTSHILTSDYSKIIVVSKAPDAVDFALFNHTLKGDIIVTQDYGVAAMALGKGAYAIHHKGKEYLDENIDQMLMERHIAKKVRMAGGRLKGSTKKRTSEEGEKFRFAFHRICKKAMNNS